jgi:hypothetical protein
MDHFSKNGEFEYGNCSFLVCLPHGDYPAEKQLLDAFWVSLSLMLPTKRTMPQMQLQP